LLRLVLELLLDVADDVLDRLLAVTRVGDAGDQRDQGGRCQHCYGCPEPS
jgi:hypothetical protein